MVTGDDSRLNDSAIRRPEEDRYGFDPFARALAVGISGMAAPEGMVLAITGPWGSGKSGVVNLVEHHLRREIDAGRLQVVQFNPWWFDGREALTRGFFEALQSAAGEGLGRKARKAAAEACNAVYQRVRPAKPFLAIAGNLATSTPAGTAASAAADLAMDVLNAKRSLGRDYERLAGLLRDRPGRMLVVIDDIDRLDADEATLVFRLVKSVGRLPTVVYLLAFDRATADRHLERRFGETASQYLEKIVQVSYELPTPARPLLLQALLTELHDVMTVPDGQTTRFGNLLHDCVSPWLATPRDVVRLANAVRVGWPTVEGEADPADFLALEAIKLAYPDVHRAVQANPQLLCGIEHPDGFGRRTEGEEAARHDGLLLASVPEGGREEMRVALRRLFPRLDSVWSNLWRDAASVREWRRARLVCAREHFDTYFRLAPGGDAVTAAELAALLGRLGDADHVRSTFLDAVRTRRAVGGGSRAALLLDEVVLRAAEIPADAVPALLATLSGIADEIDVPEDDQSPGYGWGNQLRLWHLLRELTGDRLDQGRRSSLVLDLAKVAQVHWLTEMAGNARVEHRPPEDGRPPRETEPLVTPECLEALDAASLGAIRREARAGTLIGHRKLLRLLQAWHDRAGDGGRQVRRWTRSLLGDASTVVALARALTFMGEVRALGGHGFLADRIATRLPQVSREAIARCCEPDLLSSRVDELLAGELPEADKDVLERFAEGLQRSSSSKGSD